MSKKRKLGAPQILAQHFTPESRSLIEPTKRGIRAEQVAMYAPEHVKQNSAGTFLPAVGRLERSAHGNGVLERQEVKDGGMPLALESDMPRIHQAIMQAHYPAEVVRDQDQWQYVPDDSTLRDDLVKDRISNYFQNPELEASKLAERPPMVRHDKETLALANLLFDRYLELAKEWHGPHAVPTTASNFELVSMNIARFSVGTFKFREKTCPEKNLEDVADAIVLLRGVNPQIDRVYALSLWHVAKFLDYRTADSFLNGWLESSFARLEIGHRLAASFCLTDVPAEWEVKAPWNFWSLIVPPGLFPPMHEGSEECAARFWCVGSEPAYVITNRGNVHGVLDRLEKQTGPIYDAMRALIRCACLALSNPDDFKKEKQHKPTARANGKNRHGAPDFEQARFLLSAPVEVDFREILHEALTGKTRHGSSPKVVFSVRGHWKQQACGPKQSQRKRIWVQPYYKGPEGSRVLLRTYEMKE